MVEMMCASCKKKVTNTVGTAEFRCPSCDKTKITRCRNCRQIGARYRCSECGFEGPN